jgi:hypothetical protein
MPDRWADFNESLRTRACASDAHQDCSHVSGMGGGFNPRRLRPEFGVGLCPCACHKSCPVAITAKRVTVPMATWRNSCTCPGAVQERREMPDFDQLREQARHRSQQRKAAFEATRARAAGKSNAEIRQIYASELRARGLNVPAERILDAAAERITGNPIPAVRIAGESLVQMGKKLSDLVRLLRGGQ